MREPIHSGKVSEAALSKSIAVSVVGILLCMICLVGTTWAWYSLSIESGANMTEGANFDFNVGITDNVEPENGIYSFAGGTHTVTLTKTGTAEKGFCKVEATKTGEETNTSYYIVDFTGKEFIEFTVKGSGTLKLIPMWGTPVETHDENLENNTIVLASDAVAMTPPPKQETQPDETGSPTDGETGTSEGNITEGGQTPPDAGETQSSDTPKNSEPTDETTTEPVSEPTTEQPTETPVETTTQE